jgi:hypothetical protein
MGIRTWRQCLRKAFAIPLCATPYDYDLHPWMDSCDRQSDISRNKMIRLSMAYMYNRNDAL